MILKKWIPLILILATLVAFFYFHLYNYLTFDMLKIHHQELMQWTTDHYVLAMITFILIYIVATAISIPGAVFLTLIGGFLFGTVWGSIYVMFSASIGAILIFLAVHTAIGDYLTKRASGWVSNMEQGFKKDAFNYLLVLRLIPLFPFWLVNIVPALLGVPLKTFVLATVIGIIPGSIVYVAIGSGLGSIFAENQTLQLNIIFTPKILLPLIGLALLSLAPVIYKKLSLSKGRRGGAG